ncbi:hypothetical protein MLD52_22410 [Puniceicoccaceae bacterium K14]|nr:hypothetical protein [Puniceicoccaceae bacterium K14]
MKDIQPVRKSDLEKLHTGSLLTRLQNLRECEESFELSDLDSGEIEILKSGRRIHVKDSDEWKNAYSEVKAVLSSREHLPSAKERKEARLKKARSR